MKSTLITLRKELETVGFPKADETRLGWLLESGIDGQLIVTNGVYDSDEKISLNIKGISETKIGVEIAYSNQMLNDEKMNYLNKVNRIVARHNENLERLLDKVENLEALIIESEEELKTLKSPVDIQITEKMITKMEKERNARKELLGIK